MTKVGLRVVCGVVAAMLPGCGAMPGHYATAEGRAELGRIAYTTGEFEPTPGIHFAMHGKWSGAGRGFAAGFAACAVQPATIDGGDPDVNAAVAVFFLLVSPVCGAVGSVVGAVVAAPADTVASAEAVLQRQLAPARANAALRAALERHMRATPAPLPPIPRGSAPRTAAAISATTYGVELKAVADTVLEVSALDLRIVGEGNHSMGVQLVMTVRARLVAVAAPDAQRTVLDEFRLVHRGASFEVDATAAGEARVAEELRLACLGIIDAMATRWPRVIERAPDASGGVSRAADAGAAHLSWPADFRTGEQS